MCWALAVEFIIAEVHSRHKGIEINVFGVWKIMNLWDGV